MPFNGSGTFNRIHNWQQDAANGINISAPEMDGEDDGFAAGLSLCLTRDGQAPMTGPLNVGNQAVNNAGVISGSNAVVVLGAATGGNKGVGTINAVNLYQNGIPIMQTGIKPSNTTRTNNVALSADPHLSFAVLSGKTYKVRCLARASGGAGGIVLGIGCSASMAAGTIQIVLSSYLNVIASGTPIPNAMGANTPAVASGVIDAGGFDFVLLEATFTTTGAGNVYLTWAQNSSNAAGTSVLAGSWMELVQLN